MTPTPRRQLIVDAANVVGARPADKWWRDRAGAARRLLTALARWPQDDWDVTLIVEGTARSGVPEGIIDGVKVVHAPGSGDDEIVRVTAEAGGPVTVVTADRGLRERVRGLGAETAGPGWLWQQVDPQP